MRPNWNTIIWTAVAGAAFTLAWVLLIGSSHSAVEENGLAENSQIIIAAVAMIFFATAGFLHRAVPYRMLYRVIALGCLAVVLRELEPDTLPINPLISAWFDDPGQVILLTLIFLAAAGIVITYRYHAWPTLIAWLRTPAGHALLAAFIFWMASYGFDNPHLHWEYPEEILEAVACTMLALAALLGFVRTVSRAMGRETATGKSGATPAEIPR